ncbi:MAG: DMT family transporter, partial [Proteobacteria bacterium]|nr:DMT family transporter [Pseudomonadota bacterium]
GLSYAVYTLLNKKLVRYASAASITLRAFGVAALLALPAAWIDGGAPVPVPADWWAVAYVGVVTAGVAYLLFSQALRHISAATGVTLALGEPVVAFTLATLVLGERPGAMAFAGLVLVIAGVLVVVRAELRAARVAPRSAPQSAPQSARNAALTSSPSSSTDMA